MTEAIKDLIWVFVILIILGIIWFVTGGPLNKDSWSGPFLNDPLQNNVQNVKEKIPKLTNDESPNPPSKGASSEVNEDFKPKTLTSIYESKIRFGSYASARESSPKREYIVIEAPRGNTESINISGWSLLNSAGENYKISTATRLPQPGREVGTEAIILKPGEKVYVVTGQSPLAQNFLVNKCAGYLDQKDVFTPSLSNNCPLAEDENIVKSFKNNQCLDFIESISRCTSPTIPVSLTSEPECQSFIIQSLNYNGCVSSHRNDADFFEKEWRVYLNRNQEVWAKRREIITLKDLEGKIVDSVSY